MEKIKELVFKYKHAVLLLYLALYMPWFNWLNGHTPTVDPTPIYSVVDDMIPFCELFAVPYFLWFAYIVAGHIFLFFTSREDFVRMCLFLYVGMTVCLIIYTVFPNCQNLRVDYNTLGRDNILVDLVKMIQGVDTADNVLPSIHCLNSIGMHIAIAKSKKITKYRKTIVWSSFVLMVLIIMSTVMLKQHSILDVFAAIALSVPLYFLAYKTKLRRIRDDV
jgi:membrane-associated phospholipid phosphatase